MTPEIQLPEGEVHAWIEPLNWTEALLAEARATLSSEENKRADQFLHNLHRNRYLISHLNLRKILGQYVGIPPRYLQFEKNEFGKPLLPPAQNPTAIEFNLSHSSDRMLLGVIRKAAIGVDIEAIREESVALDIADRFFTEGENEQLRSLSGWAQVEAFFNCWTRKEAYLKALGSGLSIDPKECEVSLLPASLPKLIKSVQRSDGRDRWSLFHLSEPGYIGSVAVDRQCILKQKSG